MAKRGRKRNHRRQNGFQIPIAVVAGLAPTGVKVWEARGGGVSGMAREAGRILTGFDFWNGQFIPGAMRYGLLPIVAGLAIHWLVGKKLGLNRLLARSGIPVIRI
jgi:hypothetical protein